MNRQKVYLTLQNGTVFTGFSFGSKKDVTGELVFSTGMVGYIENLTDPSNYGQMIVQTFPLIGNYGIISSDVESDKAWATALIVREICESPSNFRMEGDLSTYMQENGVVGVYGVDTRQLTKILREEGSMNARISTKKLTKEEIENLAQYKQCEGVKAVAPTDKKVYPCENKKYSIALWNLGAKYSTIKHFTEKGCEVISMPADSTAEEILALNVDGVVVADGPGDPKENVGVIQELKKLLGKKPMYGVGLGHQLIALATGADTKKQKYGHRGSNQPVKCLHCGKVYISAQNHGYEVINDSVTCGKIKFINANDGSCEGIDYETLNAFTTQFAPEACGIGYVENPLYNKFFAMMEKEKENA